MSFKPVYVTATTLDDCWFQLLSQLYHNGRRYKITKGSYEGHERVAFDFVSGFISHPHVRPLAPIIPSSCPLPPPTTEEEIEKYFANYLMDSTLAPNEHYKYGTWLVGGSYTIPPISSEFLPTGISHPAWKIVVPNQLKWVIHHFKTAGMGNEHCFITVGYPESSFAYEVPYVNPNERLTSPCLRGLDFRVVTDDDGESYLLTCVYYRCLHKDTPVFSRVDGVPQVRTIQQLYDLHPSHTIEVVDQSGHFVKVGSVTRNEATNILQLKPEGAMPLLVTANHVIPVLRGDQVVFTPAGEINPETDRLLEPSSIEHYGSTELDLFNLYGDDTVVVRNLSPRHFNVLSQMGLAFSNVARQQGYAELTVTEELKNHPDFFNVSVGVKYTRRCVPRMFKLTYDFGFLCGCAISCGVFAPRGLRLRLKRFDVARHVVDHVTPFISSTFQGKVQVSQVGASVYVTCNSTVLHHIFTKLGIDPDNRRIPPFFFTFSKDFLAGLLDGWRTCDPVEQPSQELLADLFHICKIAGLVPYYDGALSVLKVDEASTVEWHGSTYVTREIEGVTVLSSTVDVYDIGVETDEHLFCCGSTPIVVHNSWDLVAGWPTNMGGFTLLNEYVASELGIQPGPLAFACKSLHCYDFAFDYLKARIGK